jgi:hypothetical protein
MKREVTITGGVARVSFKPAEALAGEGLRAAAMANAGPHWDGHYKVPMKGRSPEAIAAAVKRLDVHHAVKAARLNGFSTIWGTTLVVDGETYTWQDLTVREHGTNVDLVATVVGGGQKVRLKVVYPKIEDVPSDGEIAELVAEKVRERMAVQSAADEKAAQVMALLGGGG